MPYGCLSPPNLEEKGKGVEGGRTTGQKFVLLISMTARVSLLKDSMLRAPP